MFSFFSRKHLSKFKTGDKVEIITCPRKDGADAYKGYKGVIVDIEIEEHFTNGVGSISIKGETSKFTACGIVNRLKLKHIT